MIVFTWSPLSCAYKFLLLSFGMTNAMEDVRESILYKYLVSLHVAEIHICLRREEEKV